MDVDLQTCNITHMIIHICLLNVNRFITKPFQTFPQTIIATKKIRHKYKFLKKWQTNLKEKNSCEKYC